MKKLNLGCGNHYLEGWVNADCSKLVKADVYFDANEFPYPFKENEFDYILLDNVLEHLKDGISVVKELHRIGKPNAVIEINVPYHLGPSASVSMQHYGRFSYETLDEFGIKAKGNKHDVGVSNGLFNVESRLKFHKGHRILGIEWLANKYPSFYEAYLAGVFPAWEVQYKLTVVK